MRLFRQMRERYGITPTIREMREHAEATPLRRSIGWIQLTALGVGAIVGAGVFSIIGVAAATSAGPAVALSFVIAAVVALLTALVYAELATMIPVSGSAYTYGYAAGGELFAWLVGWALILSYGIGNAALASSFSDNLTGLLGTFGVIVPAAWSATPGSGGVIDVPAFFVVMLITLLLLRPVRESATANALLVAMKLGVLAIFLVVAVPNADVANLTPFAPFGVMGVLGGAALVFFAFLGFDAISTAAEETRDPQRDLPRGIIGSLVVTTILFVVIALALTAVARYDTLNNAEPLAVALRAAGFPWLGAVMNVGGLIAALTVLLVFQLATVRVVLALCRDGLLPRRLASVSARHGTPNRLTLALGLLVAVTAALVPLGILVLITNVATLFIFGAAMYAVLRLRKTAPDAPRSFRTPLVPWLPILGILSCAGLTALAIVQEPRAGIGTIAWMGLGLMIYAAYGAQHSMLRRRKDADAGAP
ncbi:MAG TPA: amino acid permease [Candidatus Thermoplasmatota archaeon]|nr:amino acid permease [Candidatus Thermoplasmatota archaeon]